MYIIAGLGNPERKYDGTRHNIGFSAITVLADKYDISLDIKKHKAICGKGYIEGQKVILAMPQTYMNLSGESIREKGSAGGHNGIKNIISHLGTQVFPRVRVGVGEKPKGWDLADYVLGRFSKDEEPVIREALDNVTQACDIIVNDDIRTAMNKFN